LANSRTVKTSRHTQPNAREDALRALKIAVVEGASYRYPQLFTAAVNAGATEDEIDVAAYEALHALLAGAEQPLTARQLAHAWQFSHRK
jgi:hypothetical protein